MQKSVPVLLGMALLVVSAILIYRPNSTIATIRNVVLDTLQRVSPREPSDQRVIVIDIDEESLRRLGGWPWPRDRLAALVGRLRATSPAAIAFDIVLSEPDPTSPSQSLSRLTDLPLLQDLASRLPDHDRLLAAEIASVPLVTSFSLHDRPTRFSKRQPAQKQAIETADRKLAGYLLRYQGARPTLQELESAASGNGAASIDPDADGITRRLPLLSVLGDSLLPALAAESLRVSAGHETYRLHAGADGNMLSMATPRGINSIDIGPLSRPTNADGTIFLHFAPSEAQHLIPAWQVLEGTFDPVQLDGAIALVGSTSPEIQEFRTTPLGSLVPKVEIQAQAVAQVMNGTYLTRPTWATVMEASFTFVIGLILMAITTLQTMRRSTAVWALSIGAAWTGCWFGFADLRYVIDPLTPSLAITAAFAIVGIAQYRANHEESNRIRAAFSAHVPHEVLGKLLDKTGLAPYDGESRICSCVHASAPGFHKRLKHEDPEAAYALHAAYMEAMATTVFGHGGMLCSTPDGAITAIFSVPLEQNDHASIAVACARDMKAVTTRFADAARKEGKAPPGTVIGVDSGTLVLGGTGGDAMLDNLLLGAPLAMATKLATLSRETGATMCVSNRTVTLCPSFTGRPIGQVQVAEESELLEVFDVLDSVSMSNPAIRAYDAAYELMAHGKPAAMAAFQRLTADHPEDALAAFHLRRLGGGASDAILFMENRDNT